MELTRRSFLKTAGGAGLGLAVAGSVTDLFSHPARAPTTATAGRRCGGLRRARPRSARLARSASGVPLRGLLAAPRRHAEPGPAGAGRPRRHGCVPGADGGTFLIRNHELDAGAVDVEGAAPVPIRKGSVYDRSQHGGTTTIALTADNRVLAPGQPLGDRPELRRWPDAVGHVAHVRGDRGRDRRREARLRVRGRPGPRRRPPSDQGHGSVRGRGGRGEPQDRRRLPHRGRQRPVRLPVPVPPPRPAAGARQPAQGRRPRGHEGSGGRGGSVGGRRGWRHHPEDHVGARPQRRSVRRRLGPLPRRSDPHPEGRRLLVGAGRLLLRVELRLRRGPTAPGPALALRLQGLEPHARSPSSGRRARRSTAPTTSRSRRGAGRSCARTATARHTSSGWATTASRSRSPATPAATASSPAPCFAPNGRTFFVNIQDPGLTFAITGPFRG